MSGTNSLILCTDSSNTDLFTSGAFYLPLLGGSTGRTYSSPTALTQIPVNTSLTFSNLGLRANTNTYSGGSTAVLNFQKNASNGSQSVICTGAGVAWISDATHSDSLAANDTYNTALVANSGGPDIDITIFQAQVNNTSPNVPYGFNNGGATNAFTGSTRYTNVIGYGSGGQTSETNIVQSQAQSAGTLSHLAINITATASATFTANSRIGGSNGAQTVAATTLGFTTDATHSDSIAAGSLIDTSFVATGGTPTASCIKYNFAGTISAHDIGCATDSSGTSVSSSSTAYFYFGGITGSAMTTETWTEHVFPYALTATQLRINVQTWTETSTLVSRKSGPANGNQSVSVTGTGYAGDATHSDVFAANAVANSKYTQGAGGANTINDVLLTVDDGSVLPSTGTRRHNLINN